MSLTEEQRKIMEQNRIKALEKRAARQKNDVIESPVSKKNCSQLNTASKAVFSSPILQSSTHKNSSPSPFSKKASGRMNTTPKSSGSSTSSAAKPIVSFQLISRKRFVVEAPFNNDMVEIFKKIPSKSYDPQTRKWSFGLSDHQKLLEALGPFLANFQLKPLPHFVINMFRNAPVEKKIPEIDISCIDPQLMKSLLPFQKQAIYFGVHHGGRILIADDMGLGKTLQALALAHYYLEDWPLLIVTPSSMKYSWNEAIRTWLPSVPLHHIQVLCSGKDYIDKDLGVTICSYDLMSRKAKELTAINYKTIIFDESHLLKCYRSQRTKSAQSVSQNAKRVILCSGTPALSRPEELYSQIQLLDTKTFPGFHTFGLRYCDGKQTNFGMNYGGATNMTELQLILEERYMIRRLKSEVLSQLPSKQRQMIVLDPSQVKSNTSAMKVKASCMNDKNLKALEQRGALLSYYSESAKAKSQAVCSYIEDLLDSGKKFLCFAHHQQMLDDISSCVRAKSIEFIRIDGSVSAEERKVYCDRFQIRDAVRVAVLSITAANAGLTLTAAHLVVFAELFWNPGILTQAEDRAHRIGQQDSVVVQYLVAKGTADDYLWPLVQRKLDVLSQAGLSKDNFHEANTTQLTSSGNAAMKQTSVQDYLESLSMEDFDDLMEEEAREPCSKRPKTC